MILNTFKTSVKSSFLNATKKAVITNNRKILLSEISNGIAKEYSKNKLVNLNFICTHNSRRSQLSQVWSYFAADYFKLNIKTFSGGTEVSSFHRNTVKTLQKAGFSFQLEDFSHQNPKYSISFENTNSSILGFSKRYNHPLNNNPFIAITTCNNADTNCPHIPSASHRYHLPFIDPKLSDGTDEQNETYFKTSQQIAAEMFYIFNEIQKLISI